MHHLLTAAICLVLAAVMEQAERQSRAWYTDRVMLRASGFFIGLAAAFAAAAIF